MATSKQLNQQDPKVILDAVRLSKAQFVELYEQLGYNKVLLGVQWHNIRVSPKAKELYPEGKDTTSAPLTVISEMQEEVQERLAEGQGNDNGKNIKGKKEKVAKEPKAAKQKKEKVVKEKTAKVKVEKPEPTPDASGRVRGDKTRIANELIAAGTVDVPTLMEKAGVAKLYAQMLIRNYKKANKKVA